MKYCLVLLLLTFKYYFLVKNHILANLSHTQKCLITKLYMDYVHIIDGFPERTNSNLIMCFICQVPTQSYVSGLIIKLAKKAFELR